MACKEDLNQSYVKEYCVVVGEYKKGFLYTNGYKNLKDMYLEKATDINIPGLYDENGVLNEEVYNNLSIIDINNDIQQVILGEYITENLEENEDGSLYEKDENFFCPVRVNGRIDKVKIPKYLYE